MNVSDTENNLEDGLKLKRFLVEEGKAEIDFEMAKEVARAFTGSMYELVKDAPNYVEVEVFHRDSGESLILTVQKRGGKTAHQLRKEAETQVELLKAELEGKRVEINKKDREYLLIRDHNKKLCEKINHLNDLNYELGENLKAAEDQNHYFQLMGKYRDENHKLKAELEKAMELIRIALTEEFDNDGWIEIEKQAKEFLKTKDS